MAIKRNSAKCNLCEVEVESTHRHHFNVHSHDGKMVFAVDGGKDYLRRVGSNWTDTSIADEEEDE